MSGDRDVSATPDDPPASACRRSRPRLPQDPRTRWALGLAALVAVLAIGGALWDALVPEPSGPPSSSYATVPTGAAAFAELLERRGRRVVRAREDPRDRQLDPGGTLIVIEPGSLAGDDRRAIARFVRDGGRLVVAGRGSEGLAGELLARPPRRDDRGERTAVPVTPAPEAVGPVRTSGDGRWREAGQALPVLAARDGALLVTANAGRGKVLLLASASPLQNRLLAQADNAALALALAPRGRPVTFLESVHGYGRDTGLAALPDRWKWLLAGLGLAALIFVLARIRRFGPPEEAVRDLPPPRKLYVEAVGRTLVRTRSPREASAPVRDESRRLVLARSGLPADAGTEEVRAAARRLGLDEDEVRVIAEGPATREDVLAAGRALATLSRGAR